MTERLITEWKNIHELLRAEDGSYLCSMSTLLRKYAPGLRARGVVMQWTKGKGKNRRRVVATWPTRFINDFTRLYQIQQEYKKSEKS